MMAFALEQQTQVTGLRRALFELSIGLSAAAAFEEIQKAMIGHACRSVTYRMILELGSAPDQRFHSGGFVNGLGVQD